MVTFPGCKINIGLNIIEKRLDGFHNLESIFYPINLSDILEIVASKSFEFTFSGISVDGKIENNLVYRAYQALKTEFDLPMVKIHLHKIVPLGAGLGGGSADAAATLVVLNDLFDLKLTIDKLEVIADSIGSDCAFFIKNKVAYVQGKGEIVSNHDLDLSGFYLKIVNPGIHIQTKSAFSQISSTKSGESLENLHEDSIHAWQGTILNQFEQTVFQHYPVIESLKKDLRAEGAIYSSMTGTGSSVYAIFEKEPTQSFPSYFEWITKL